MVWSTPAHFKVNAQLNFHDWAPSCLLVAQAVLFPTNQDAIPLTFLSHQTCQQPFVSCHFKENILLNQYSYANGGGEMVKSRQGHAALSFKGMSSWLADARSQGQLSTFCRSVPNFIPHTASTMSPLLTCPVSSHLA